MIATLPSLRIEDFIRFCRLAGNLSAVDNRIGVSADEILKFEAISGFALPQFYSDYLAEFGKSDGGLSLFGDSDSQLEAIVDVYRVAAQRGWKATPDNTVLIATQVLTGAKYLHYNENFRTEEPRVVVAYDDIIESVAAVSFQHYIYSQAFLVSRYAWNSACSISLLSRDSGIFDSIISFSVGLGFQPYWFCDEYQACLERNEEHLYIELEAASITFYINCKNRSKRELKRSYMSHFDLIDVSEDR